LFEENAPMSGITIPAEIRDNEVPDDQQPPVD
jgi:hypothetical protein